MACPRVLHVSRCPNVNPQGWPGLWPDAQHSLLSPSRPLGGCQVLAGTRVAGVAGERREEGKKGLEWRQLVGLSSPVVLHLQVDRRSRCSGQRFWNEHQNSWVTVSVSHWNYRERLVAHSGLPQPWDTSLSLLPHSIPQKPIN